MFFSDLVWFLIGEKTNLDIQKRSFLKISSSFTISKSLPFKIIFSTRPKRWQVCPKDDVNSRITWKYFRYSRLKGSILLRQFRVFRGALYSKTASSIQMSPVFCACSVAFDKPWKSFWCLKFLGLVRIQNSEITLFKCFTKVIQFFCWWTVLKCQNLLRNLIRF